MGFETWYGCLELFGYVDYVIWGFEVNLIWVALYVGWGLDIICGSGVCGVEWGVTIGVDGLGVAGI